MVRHRFGLSAIALLSLATAFSSCNSSLNVEDYVDQKVDLQIADPASANRAGDVVFKGSIGFTSISHFTSYRQECDQEICGTTEHEVCDPVERCTGGGEVCEPVERCTGG